MDHCFRGSVGHLCCLRLPSYHALSKFFTISITVFHSIITIHVPCRSSRYDFSLIQDLPCNQHHIFATSIHLTLRYLLVIVNPYLLSVIMHPRVSSQLIIWLSNLATSCLISTCLYYHATSLMLHLYLHLINCLPYGQFVFENCCFMTLSLRGVRCWRKYRS